MKFLTSKKLFLYIGRAIPFFDSTVDHGLAQVWRLEPIKALIVTSSLIYTYFNYYRLLIVNSITSDIVNYPDHENIEENIEKNISINTHALRKSHAEKCLRKDLIDR